MDGAPSDSALLVIRHQQEPQPFVWSCHDRERGTQASPILDHQHAIQEGALGHEQCGVDRLEQEADVGREISLTRSGGKKEPLLER